MVSLFLGTSYFFIAIINSNEYLLSVPKYVIFINLRNPYSTNRKTKTDKTFLKKWPT